MPTDRARDLLIDFNLKLLPHLRDHEVAEATEELLKMLRELEAACAAYGIHVDCEPGATYHFTTDRSDWERAVSLRLRSNPPRLEAVAMRMPFGTTETIEPVDCRWDRRSGTWIGAVPERDSTKTAPVHRVETVLSTVLPMLSSEN